MSPAYFLPGAGDIWFTAEISVVIINEFNNCKSWGELFRENSAMTQNGRAGNFERKKMSIFVCILIWGRQIAVDKMTDSRKKMPTKIQTQKKILFSINSRSKNLLKKKGEQINLD